MQNESNSRRRFLLTGTMALAASSGAFAENAPPALRSQQLSTETLEIAVGMAGPENGRPVVLVHDLGYSTHSFNAVADLLANAGLRVIVPSLRGHGATRYRDPATPRSGQQAALGRDLLDLIDALHVPEAVFAGFGWGASAAAAMAALRPSRSVGMVLASDEGLDHEGAAAAPLTPAAEAALWHQYYFQTERGRLALQDKREAVMREVWRRSHRHGALDEAVFAASAPAFQNPDFVATVIHAYRYRLGNVAGDPRYAKAEQTLATRKRLSTKLVAFEGDASVRQYASGADRAAVRRIAGAGHDVPRDAPHEFAAALIAVAQAATWRT